MRDSALFRGPTYENAGGARRAGVPVKTQAISVVHSNYEVSLAISHAEKAEEVVSWCLGRLRAVNLGNVESSCHRRGYCVWGQS